MPRVRPIVGAERCRSANILIGMACRVELDKLAIAANWFGQIHHLLLLLHLSLLLFRHILN